MAMITNVEDYFSSGCGRCDRFGTSNCSTRRWVEGLNALRGICLGAGLVETVKWGHPTYTRNDRNIAIIGAFRDDFRLNFFNPALMKDPYSVLEKQGEASQVAGMIRFTDNAAVAAMAMIINAYLYEAIDYADAGIKAPRTEVERELPAELVEALDADPELAEAFFALTRGRRNSYVVNLNGAKTAETRLRRIAKFRDRIMAGKGALER